MARVVVWKKANTISPTDTFFLPVVSAKPAAAGFEQVADYPARALFRGPKSAAAKLIADLKADGFDVELASDLDSLSFHDYTINADTGQVTPQPASVAYTPSGDEGLYFVVLEGYPTEAWLADLTSRDIVLVEGLAPASYIARGKRIVMTSLRESTNYVRGAFPLQPALKRTLFEPAPPPEPFQWVSVQVSEGDPAGPVKTFLDSMSQGPVEVVSREPEKAIYEALVSDFDISTLANFESVYAIAPTRLPVSVASERQAVLITRTDSQAGTLPTTSPDYVSYLTSHGIAWTANSFDNTVVGMVDTGFDNADISMAGIQPDFKFNFGGTNYTTIINLTRSGSWADSTDENAHGTITSSVVTGYAPSGQRGENGYRYSLGLAPTVRVAMDKTLRCAGFGGTLTQSLSSTRLGASSPNVINMSYNTRGDLGGCQYGTDSQIADTRTRDPLLFTVSAGNSTEGCSGNHVRAPATGKNVIAVGATENYTIGWTTSTPAGTCLYNGYPPAWSQSQDARNVAYYSAQRDPLSMVKPDLVAPGDRITGPFTRGTICSNVNPPYGVTCNTNIDTQGGVQYAFSRVRAFRRLQRRVPGRWCASGTRT